MFTPEEKWIENSTGVHTYYSIERKDFPSPMFVFLHGLGGDLSAWDKERTLLSKQGYSSLAIDLRGHGKSSRPENEEAYSFDEFAQDVGDVLKKEDIKNAVLIGHCFGGMVAMTIVGRQIYSPQALILIDTDIKPPLLSRMVHNHKSMVALIHSLLRHANTHYLEGRADYEKFKNSNDIDARRFFSDVTHMSLKSYLSAYLHLASFNGSDIVSKISVPTLIISGTHDSIYPPETALSLSSLIVDSELQFIKGGNHILVLNKEKDLVKSIVAFTNNNIHTNL